MIDAADKAQREIRRHKLRLWLEASSSISVLKRIEDELARLDYIDNLEAERDALKAIAALHEKGERDNAELRKELEDERIRARQYQVRAENDA